MSDDIAAPRECYSNWLMGNSHASPQGAASKRSHLPGGWVVLTGPGSAPVVLDLFFSLSPGRGSSCSSPHSLSAAVLVRLLKTNRQVGVSILGSAQDCLIVTPSTFFNIFFFWIPVAGLDHR